MSLDRPDLLRRIDARFSRGDVKGGIPAQLPLLDYLDILHAVSKRQAFAGWRCLLVHHFLGSLVPLVDLLHRAGIDRDEIFLVGKAYSSNPEVIADLAGKGYSVVNAIDGYTSSIPYDEILTRVLRERLEWLFRKPQKLLLLDDGGKALSLIADCVPQPAPPIAAVELTSRGANALVGRRLSFPVVNVARSPLKTIIEGRMIALSMIAELECALARWLPNRRIDEMLTTVRGYGAIGRNVADILRSRGSTPRVVEIDEAQAACARADGFEVAQHLDGELIIGCTGTSSFTPEHVASLQPGALLVSMGSSDLEFAPWRYIKLLRPRGQAARAPWKYMFRGRSRGRCFFLANGGFPIDFSGSIDPIPARLIQITRALLFAGAMQAVTHSAGGLYPLSTTIQEEILTRFEELNDD